MRIDVAPITELPRFVKLLEELGDWLWSRGIKQWEPGSNRADIHLIQRYLASGHLLLATCDSGLAGGCIVTSVPTQEWAFAPGPSAYLHKLAVARQWSGKGLGSRLIAEAIELTQESRLLRLRLDCWDGNDVLRAYYRRNGFRELDAVPSHDYLVRLFERDATDDRGRSEAKPPADHERGVHLLNTGGSG